MRALFVSIVVLCVVSPVPVRAELEQNGGFWLTGLTQGSFEAVSSKLSRLRWWFDAQLRIFESKDGFGQGLVRPGLGWAFGKRSSMWLNYAWIQNSPALGSATDEHRIWEQVI